MRQVTAIILGGGRGTRLYPLTKRRAKPAVPIGGKYRLIDIPVSNCINSGIQHIYILTQFNSASLNRHVSQTYQFSRFSDGFCEILAAEQTDENPNWFQGTADAVRQYLWLLEPSGSTEYLILSGDHLYRMDYSQFVRRHRETNADVTIAVLPCDLERASDFGLIKTDADGRVVQFTEKPKGAELERMRVDTTTLGLTPEEAERRPFIASMGIYVFRHEVMLKLLRDDPSRTDFGKEILPACLDDYNVQAYLFDDYWEDIGTIEAFYKANLALTSQNAPPFSFYHPAPIYTRPRYLPPSKLIDCQIAESIITEGCIIKQARIFHSVLGLRSRIESGVRIEDSLLMGADFYETPIQREESLRRGLPPVGIGERCVIQKAIIDKNARIGNDVRILNKERPDSADHPERGFYIRNGIVIVPKDTVIPDGTVI
ncbi:MAG: glucose-1-phosphate adenylyltransferase [Aphanocapsa lilacina HA4352-LM1]|jgi:glucose-1-phosphate adenylyltransferase|nr:glucose-1-phosphate adenylyltransferase [Aphanocapsa lilacina HA4352-LM1]